MIGIRVFDVARDAGCLVKEGLVQLAYLKPKAPD